MRSAKVWVGRVLACGHGRKPLGPECEKVLHNWRRRRGLGQHGSGHDRKARRDARACHERPGDHQHTLYQREQLHRSGASLIRKYEIALLTRSLTQCSQWYKTKYRTARNYFDFIGRLRSTRIWWAQM